MSNLKVAQDVHHKFEFYIIALAFTTAAFATQTGRFTGLVIGDAIEVLSWILLVLSGVLGLMRLEYLPVAYRAHDSIRAKREDINRYQHYERYRDSVMAMRADVAETEPKLKVIEVKFQRRYRWQMRFLVAGFGVLIVSRVLAQFIEHY
jgi:hypothetical protein